MYTYIFMYACKVCTHTPELLQTACHACFRSFVGWYPGHSTDVHVYENLHLHDVFFFCITKRGQLILGFRE